LRQAEAGVLTLGVLLLLFFCGFNVLEAGQASLASRLAPAHARGSAMDVYNTLQSLGFFAGGGWFTKAVVPGGRADSRSRKCWPTTPRAPHNRRMEDSIGNTPHGGSYSVNIKTRSAVYRRFALETYARLGQSIAHLHRTIGLTYNW
jgi:hypothetical protein